MRACGHVSRPASGSWTCLAGEDHPAAAMVTAPAIFGRGANDRNLVKNKSRSFSRPKSRDTSTHQVQILVHDIATCISVHVSRKKKGTMLALGM